MSNIDPQTGLSEDSSLKDRACALAMAQCATIEPPYTWLQAYHELEELSDDSVVPESFVMCEWIDESEGWDSVYNQVQCEADAIEVQLQAAFVMGTKFASDCAAEAIHKLKEKLREVGVCPECLTVAVHQITEPFSSCACGTGEDYAERPLQKLQRLEAGLKDLLDGEPIDKQNRDINGLLGEMGRDLAYCERKGQHLAKIIETKWTI